MTNATRLVAILICSSSIPLIHGQAKPSFPLPEFYGTYAVSDGTTVGLDSDANYPNKAVVKLGVRNNAQSVCRNGTQVAQSPRDAELPVFSPNVRFIVFLQASGPASPMAVAQDMQLSAIGFVRNIEIGNCPNAGMSKQGVENGWDQTIKQVQLRVGPIPGQQEMVVSVPSSPLTPGVYSLSFDPISGAFKRTFLFAVQPITEAANSQCVDLSLQYNAFMFNNGGEIGLNTVPCGSKANTSSGEPIGASTSSAQPSLEGKKQATGTSGLAALAEGRYEEAKKNLSDSVDSGQEVALSIVEHKAMSNTGGVLTIKREQIGFAANSKDVFRIPISTISVPRIGLAALADPNAFYFDLLVDGKKHRFEYQPEGTQCQFENGNNLVCDGSGLDQQRVIAEWVRDMVLRYAGDRAPK